MNRAVNDIISKRKIRNEFDNFIKYHHLDEKQTIDLLSYFISVYGKKLENKDLTIDEIIKKEDEQSKPYKDDLKKLFEHLTQEIKEFLIEHPKLWGGIYELVQKHKKYAFTNRFEPSIDFTMSIEDIEILLKYGGLANNDMYIGFSVGDDLIDLQ